jgi:hypothetical protein
MELAACRGGETLWKIPTSLIWTSDPVYISLESSMAMVVSRIICSDKNLTILCLGSEVALYVKDKFLEYFEKTPGA